MYSVISRNYQNLVSFPILILFKYLKLIITLNNHLLEFERKRKALHCVKSVRIRSPPFGLNTERYGVSLRIQYKCGKIRTRKTPNTDTEKFHRNAYSNKKCIALDRCSQFLPGNLRNSSHASNFVCLFLLSTKAEFFIVNQVIHLLWKDVLLSILVLKLFMCQVNLQVASFWMIAPFLDVPFNLKLRYL